MQPWPRLLLTVVSALVTYFVLRVTGALLFYGRLSPGTSRLVAAAAAVGAACVVWTLAASSHPGLGRAVTLGALITGAIAFAAGFFGPILLTPAPIKAPCWVFLLLDLWVSYSVPWVVPFTGWCAGIEAPVMMPPNNRWRGP